MMSAQRRTTILPLCMALMVSSLLVACSRSSPTPAPAPSADSPTFRIVCLSPALTDVLIDLGLESSIVGRDIWDQQLSDSVPRIGDLYQLDYEALIALQPTDVILQVHPTSVPSFLRHVAQEEGFRVVAVHINSLADILDAMHELNEQLSFTNAQAQQTDAQRKAGQLESRINAAMNPLPADLKTQLGPVLILHHMEPPAAFGPGSYLAQVLQRLGAPASITTGGPWQELDLETIVRLDPWAIILIKPGADPESDPKSFLGPLANLDLSAVMNHRVAALNHPEALLPGTCIGEVAAQVRDLLTGFATLTTESGGSDQ